MIKLILMRQVSSEFSYHKLLDAAKQAQTKIDKVITIEKSNNEWFVYAEFETEEDAALFKLTYI